jgi:GntR family transcriptional regulator
LTGAVDRDSPVPFYFQLAEVFEDEISTGRWKPGWRLPSEPDVCAHYSLSRTTVRQALARLEQEGLVARVKGRGTFVLGRHPRSWLIQTTDAFFRDEFLRTGHRVTSKVLRREVAALPELATDLLGLPYGSKGMVFERLRAVDSLVALYVVNYLPEHLAEVVLGMSDPHESLYRAVAEKGFVTIAGGRRSVEAVSASPKLAELLEVKPETALAYIESVSWDGKRQPFDCYQAWLRTDRIRLDITVASSARGDRPFPDLQTTDGNAGQIGQ